MKFIFGIFLNYIFTNVPKIKENNEFLAMGITDLRNKV